MPDDHIPLTEGAVAAIAAYFAGIRDEPMPSDSADTWPAALRYTAEARKAEASEIIALGAALPTNQRLAYLAIRELVDKGFMLRGQAYYAAPKSVQETIPGGSISRAHIHKLSPEADRLDRLALAIANAIPGLDPETRIDMCI